MSVSIPRNLLSLHQNLGTILPVSVQTSFVNGPYGLTIKRPVPHLLRLGAAGVLGLPEALHVQPQAADARHAAVGLLHGLPAVPKSDECFEFSLQKKVRKLLQLYPGMS